MAPGIERCVSDDLVECNNNERSTLTGVPLATINSRA